MVRLRRVSPSDRGWTRRRAGSGFVYLDHQGDRLPPEDVERVKAIVIPPAWRDVWICPVPNGHLQAVGTDDAGRRQYLYHPDWRIKQDELKFDRVLRAARRLPKAREVVREHLTVEGMPRARAAAAAVRLLDLGYFRIGGDVSGQEESFGLTTLERRHVRRNEEGLLFDFVGKSGVEQRVEVSDRLVVDAVEAMRRRRGGERLLAYRDASRWCELDAAEVNDYLREIIGEEFTAKDFRTWHATVLAAAALAESGESGETPTSRKRAVRQAMVEVSDYLGNTPTIARSSYVDPRVVDLYEDGVTIRAATSRRQRDPAKRQAALERAVRRMLS